MPAKGTGVNDARFEFKLPSEMLAAIKKAAREHDVSEAAVVREAVLLLLSETPLADSSEEVMEIRIAINMKGGESHAYQAYDRPSLGQWVAV